MVKSRDEAGASAGSDHLIDHLSRCRFRFAIDVLAGREHRDNHDFIGPTKHRGELGHEGHGPRHLMRLEDAPQLSTRKSPAHQSASGASPKVSTGAAAATQAARAVSPPAGISKLPSAGTR